MKYTIDLIKKYIEDYHKDYKFNDLDIRNYTLNGTIIKVEYSELRDNITELDIKYNTHRRVHELEINLLDYITFYTMKEPKQETLEEAAWELAKQKFEEKCNYKPNLSNSQDLLVVSSIQEGILIGAKWQQDMTDNWLTMKEGDITVNFKPMPEFDEPAYPTRLDQLKEQAWEEIIREFYRDAQKVPIGAPPLMIECWLVDNYNPPTKKQNNE